MISVNLLPEEIARQQTAFRRLRVWLVLVLCAAAGGATSATWALTRQAQAAALEAGNTEIRESRSGLQSELIAAAQQTRELQRRIDRSNALRNKRLWSSLIGFIGGCMPDEIWLTSMNTDVPSAAARKQDSPGSPPNPKKQSVRLAAPTRLMMRGYALDHKHVYAFMSRLKQTDVFQSVELLKSGREPVLAGQAVRFELQCKW